MATAESRVFAVKLSDLKAPLGQYVFQPCLHSLRSWGHSYSRNRDDRFSFPWLFLI